MPFKSWQPVKWRDVKGDETVKTRDGKEWFVCAAWNGERVMLAPRTPLGKVGLPTPVALVDGDREVQVSRDIPREPASPEVQAFIDRVKTATGSPPMKARLIDKDGEAPWCDGCGKYVAGCTCSTERPKFGQPKPTDEQRDSEVGNPMSDAAVIVEAQLGAELVSETTVDVETGSVLHRVPKQLDRLALVSHLYLMHGIYGQDVEDYEALAGVHQRAHATETYVAAHEHVSREEVLGDA